MTNITKKLRDKAWEAIGGLSRTTKMPWWSYSLPAGLACPGSAERCKHPDAVCAVCYAKKGAYRFKEAKAAMARRLEIVRNLEDPGGWLVWCSAMTLVLKYEADKRKTAEPGWVPRFRWHDSGDVVSVIHARAIMEVALRCPDIQFWLPTQERELVWQASQSYTRLGIPWPDNLCVRFGFRDIDQRNAPDDWWLHQVPGMTWSSVVTDPEKVTCPATLHTKTCEEAGCSLCWNRKITMVKYLKH